MCALGQNTRRARGQGGGNGRDEEVTRSKPDAVTRPLILLVAWELHSSPDTPPSWPKPLTRVVVYAFL